MRQTYFVPGAPFHLFTPLRWALFYCIKTCNHLKEIVKNSVSYKKRGKLQLHCWKCGLKENCGPKNVLVKTGVFSPCLVRASAKRKISILYNFIGFFQSCENNIFFHRISLFLADFSWQLVTKLSAEASSFLWNHLADLVHNHLVTPADSKIHSDCHLTMRTGESTQRVPWNFMILQVLRFFWT